MHPTAHVTVTDIEPTSVAAIAAGDLGSHPRATVREMDATAIDAPDGSYDLAVFVMSFHHLPTVLASRVFAEGTRAADKLLIIDLPRPPSLLHMLQLASMLPFAALVPVAHDGFISSLRAYSPSALRELARHADPDITVELRRGAFRPNAAALLRAHAHQRAGAYLGRRIAGEELGNPGIGAACSRDPAVGTDQVSTRAAYLCTGRAVLDSGCEPSAATALADQHRQPFPV